MALPAMVLPFLINFGVNKAMGMSTGKALGLAGMQAMLPGAGTEGALSGGTGGGIGSLVAGGGQQTAKAFAIEGGKALAAGMADKKYGGAAPFLAYGGLQGLQGAMGAGQLGQAGTTQATGLEGLKQAFTGAPQAAQIPPGTDSMLTQGIPGLEQVPQTEADILKTIKPGDSVTKAASKEAGKKLGTGEMLGLGLAGTTLLGSMGGDDKEQKPEGLNLNYPTVKDIVTRFERRPGEQLQIGETVEERIGTGYQPRFQQGGLAQFNNGALVNKLPSKTTNDEKDYSVYRRASNFVIDESGNGNGDEDTMLAQLADGEFVTTANAVLGAGIMAGANPNDANQMRDKGAKYFYEQQARFKRIFEMLKKAKAA
jgi:hypothetical protein